MFLSADVHLIEKDYVLFPVEETLAFVGASDRVDTFVLAMFILMVSFGNYNVFG